MEEIMIGINTNEPFQLEVEIIDDSKRAEIEDKILGAIFHNKEVIPGIRINSAHKQSLDGRSVMASRMKNDFEFLMKEIRYKFNEFFDKWDNDKYTELR